MGLFHGLLNSDGGVYLRTMGVIESQGIVHLSLGKTILCGKLSGRQAP